MSTSGEKLHYLNAAPISDIAERWISRYGQRVHGMTFADPAQVVLEYDPYRRLSYTWHTFTPEWAQTFGFSDELLATVASEPRSK